MTFIFNALLAIRGRMKKKILLSFAEIDNFSFQSHDCGDEMNALIQKQKGFREINKRRQNIGK